MSFSTLTFSGPASGSSAFLDTAGTFTASITGNDDGSVTGTWSYAGNYDDSSFYGPTGFESMSGTLSGTGSPNGPWSVTLVGGPVTGNGLTLSFADGQYNLAVNAGFGLDYTVNLGYDGNYMYHDNFAFTAQLAMAGPPPGGSAPTELADTILGTSVADTIQALGGNDTVAAGEGNDTITGGAGDDSIDGGNGIDTAVFSDVRANYTIAEVPGTQTWTVTHNALVGDGTDTVVNVERLQFADEKVAIDLTGDAGQAYRLYQAAFHRVPDVPGLGYQMNALDTGLTLPQVAANFIASPEFQATYGNVTDTQFVTLLYENVLNREPEPDGLAFHLNELLTQSRADVLVHFSESPENQANVIGQIQAGMLYTFP